MKKSRMLLKIVAFLLSIIFVVQILPLSTISIAINNKNVVDQALMGSAEKNSLQVIEEVELLRDEYSKHFRCEDGSFVAAIYNTPVHYKENGEWKEIDNTLVANVGAEKTAFVSSTKYSVAKTSTPITFPENINNGNISITKNDNIISFGIKNMVSNLSSVATVSSPEELVSNSIINLQTDAESQTVEMKNTKLAIDTKKRAITYSNIFENTSVEYEVSSSMLKESILVSEKSDSYKYEFWIDFGSYVPIEDELSGGIYIYESVKSKEPIMAIAPPYMFDANNVTSDAVTMDLVQNDGSYTLVIEADKKWMNKFGRKFPVVIDPTFILDVGKNNIQDIHVNQNYPNRSYKLDYQLEVGKNNSNVYRTYINYDLPSLPDCSVVTNAELQLVQNWARDFDETDLYLNVYQCNTAWDFDTITWNTQPIQDLSSATTVDYTNYEGGMSAEYNLNVTKVVKDWYENGNKFGLMLASSDESKNEKTSFYSSRNIVNEEPIITIQYVNNTGLENYWTYDSFSLGNSGSAYINTYNGALTYIHNDVSTNGLLAPLGVSHVYLTDEKTATGTFGNMNFGKGFKLNIIEKIEEADTNVLGIYYPYKYIDADGTVHYFIRDSLISNQYHYEFGSDIILTSTSSGFVLSSPDGSRKEFNSSGYLTKTTDNNGNSITITYSDGKITQITDGGGAAVNLSYNSDNTLNYIADSTGRKTYYHYNSAGQLDYITYPDSSVTAYSYNNSLLSEIRASTGARAALEYKMISTPGNDFYRVSSYTIYGEDSLTVYDTITFDYRTCDTYISSTRTENDVVLAFDNSGRVTNQTINGKTVSTSKYNSSGNANNNISFASNTFDVAYNSFERERPSAAFYSRWDINSDGTSDNTIEDSTERTNIHEKSLKIQRTGTAGTITASRSKWYIKPNTTYTVSMFVNVADVLECGEVYLKVTACETNGSEAQELFTVNGSAVTTTDNEWQLISATINTSENTGAFIITCGLYEGIGTVYFDAYQIEEASTPGKMNLLTNGNFEDYDDRYGADSWNNTYNTFCLPYVEGNGNACVWLQGDPSVQRGFSQKVEMNGKAGDILAFGASAKALCSSSGNNGTRFFGLNVNLYSDYRTIVQSVSVEFDEQTYNTWQTVMSSIKANQDYTYVELVFCYYHEVNEVYFDNAFMYRDYYGTNYTYDSMGRMKKAENDSGQAVEYYRSGLDGVGLDIDTVTAYANGQVTQTVGYTYDNKHNVTSVTDSDGVTTSCTYNSKGLPLTSVVSAAQGTYSSSTSYTYTADNNYLKSVTDASGSTTEYEYNSRGLVSSVTDPNGNITEYEYDPDTDALLSVSNPSDALGNPSTEFEYDDAGRIIKIDTGIVDWNLYYDVFGRNDVIDNNLSATLFFNGYDDHSNLEWQCFGNGDDAEYTYDEEDRLTSETYNQTLAYEYKYSNDGMLGKVVDHESGEEWSYQYDLMNRPTRISSDDGRAVSYEYNSKNELGRFKVTDSGEKLLDATYTYDESGRVTGTQISSMAGSPAQEYTYDLLGRNDGFKNYYNGSNYVYADYAYRVVNGNETGQVQELTYYKNNSQFSNYNYSYSYDANGNITHIYNGEMLAVRYHYDGLNRLVREDNGYIDKTVVYNYDKDGDILSKTEYNLTFEDALGTAVDTVAYSYTNGMWLSAVTGYEGDNSFWYDESGNPTLYRGYTMEWSKGRQLSALSNSQLSMQFRYNQSGIRTSKTVNGVKTEYTYVGSTLVSQKTGSEVINFAYTAGGAPYGFTYNGTPYFYILSLQGDVIAIYDANGNIVVGYTYDSWGKLISITGSLASTIGVKNPIRYRGYYYDTETSLYYLQSRYYDPETCRFINADAYLIAGDDYIQGTNMYAYCYNNPVMYSDPSGRENEDSLEEFLAAFAMLCGLANVGFTWWDVIIDDLSYENIYRVTEAVGTSLGFLYDVYDLEETLDNSKNLMNKLTGMCSVLAKEIGGITAYEIMETYFTSEKIDFLFLSYESLITENIAKLSLDSMALVSGAIFLGTSIVGATAWAPLLLNYVVLIGTTGGGVFVLFELENWVNILKLKEYSSEV